MGHQPLKTILASSPKFIFTINMIMIISYNGNLPPYFEENAFNKYTQDIFPRKITQSGDPSKRKAVNKAVLK